MSPSRFCPTFFFQTRSARAFEREARVLAALNHPHIGAIYGFSIKSFDLSADGKQIPCDRIREHSDIVLIDLKR